MIKIHSHHSSWKKESWCRLPDKALARLQFEIEQVDRLLDSYTDLINASRANPPNLIEVTALGSVLHSFYNGLEAIFSTIAQEIHGEMPQGGQWHRDLFLQMAESTTDNRAVLSQKSLSKLTGYLAFRHFYRHSYSFYLDWDEMKDLVLSIFDVWSLVKSELQSFIDDQYLP